MNRKSQWISAVAIAAFFAAFYFVPFDSFRIGGPILEALMLAQWYAREHVLLCLVPAFFIAGGIAVFVSQAAVMKYLGAGANKVVAYATASVSGSILAVCSCTVLPLFAGIYRMGAGLGPAAAFLYSGPAINVLAIILTARVLGLELGIARAVTAILFSVVIGLLMHLVFRREERDRVQAAALPEAEPARPLWQTALYFAAMIGVLVFATWGRPEEAAGFWYGVYQLKWVLTSIAAAGLGLTIVLWMRVRWRGVILTAVGVVLATVIFPQWPMLAFLVGVTGLSVIAGTGPSETRSWLKESWSLARQILPLLLIGVLVAGLLLGRPGHEGIIPDHWVAGWVGGNSIGANLVASVLGALMYFATLTEVPILQGLIGMGMGKGPALALLLAGPALSLPNMLVIRSVIGTKKTLVFVALVVIMATVTGLIYGILF